MADLKMGTLKTGTLKTHESIVSPWSSVIYLLIMRFGMCC